MARAQTTLFANFKPPRSNCSQKEHGMPVSRSNFSVSNAPVRKSRRF